MTSPFSYPQGKDFFGLFNDSFPPVLDGVSLTVDNYARWLSSNGFSPCVVTPWNPVYEPRQYDVMRYFSLPIESRKPYRYGYPKLDPFIWSRLRNTDFKLLHSHSPFSSGRLAVYVKHKRGIPLIGTFHSKYRDDLRHSFHHTPWMVDIIMKRILEFFNACDEVWIPQAKVEETVREYGYKGRLQVVENGIDFASDLSSDIWALKARAKKKLGFIDDTLYLLFVGQHIWEKGLKTIVDTLKILYDDHAGKIKINFIGTGYAIADLKSAIQSSGLADMATVNGVISDRDTLRDFYAASDLFIFPSAYDNAPLVVREAAALGTPSILLKGSTAAEIITDRENGFLADNKASDFAALISHLHDNPELIRHNAAGARKTLARSWDNVMEEVMGRYKEIIKTHKLS